MRDQNFIEIRKYFYFVFDCFFAVISFVLALLAYVQVRFGPERLPLTFRVWDRFGVSPIWHHYYQPVFDSHNLPETLWEKPDPLYGINLNAESQLLLLGMFNYQEELRTIPLNSESELGFFHRNNSFGCADAEMLYNMARHFKPKRVFEIGSGHSTRILKQALDVNRDEGHQSYHVCIEPFEMPWLESLGVSKVIRKKVEDVGLDFFSELQENDILFIDSSHVLRTAGDVFFEYLQILPTLNKGVVVHIHDIFLPYEYPKEWLVSKRRYWTEQYVLQAFLACNHEFEILSAVHWLAVDHPDELAKVCPIYGQLKDVPGSFWIRRV